MKNFHHYFTINSFTFTKKQRAVSPAIALILIIGITVLAGAIIAIVSLDLLSSKTSITLDSSDPTSFASTEQQKAFYDLTSRNIDSFRVQITNSLFEPVIVDVTNTKVYNATDDSLFPDWYVSSDSTSLVLNGQETKTLQFKIDGENYNSLTNSQELRVGDTIYLIYSAHRVNDETLTFIQSEPHLITKSDIPPAIEVVLVNTFFQFQEYVYFFVEDHESITVSLTFALWNFGDPSQSHSKMVALHGLNTSVFQVDPEFESQTVTIPSSSILGDSGILGACESNEPCTLVTFPITKLNLTAAGIQRNGQANFGAIVSVSGEEFTSFKLVISEEEPVTIGLPPELDFGSGAGWGGLGGLVWQGTDTKSNVTLKLTLNLTNAGTTDFSGNIYLTDLNETVFHLENAEINMTVITIPAQGFTLVEWNITRFPVHQRDDIYGGTNSPYFVTVQLLEIITSFNVPLFIQVTGGGQSNPSTTLHIQDLEASVSGNNNKLDVTLTIYDGNNLPVKGVSLIVKVSDPSGTTIVQWTIGNTNTNGENSYSTNLGTNAISGEYIISVTQVAKTDFTWDISADVKNNLVISI